jgi:hypothetical protein
MKKLPVILFLSGLVLPSASVAIDLKEANLTQVVNDVEIIAPHRPAYNAFVDDLFKMPDVLRTGAASRAELVAADNTITRVGADTVFSFDPANRTIDLQQGSLLFHSPHGKGGGTIRTDTVVASVLGTTLIVSVAPDGTVKVLDLEGRVEVRLKNGHRQILESGQMMLVPPDGNHPSTAIFNLAEQTRNSLLVTGFTQPLPSLPLINIQIVAQLKSIYGSKAVNGALASVNGSLSAVKGTLTAAGTTISGAVGAVSAGTLATAPNLASLPVVNLPVPTLPTLQPVQSLQPIVQTVTQILPLK